MRHNHTSSEAKTLAQLLVQLLTSKNSLPDAIFIGTEVEASQSWFSAKANTVQLSTLALRHEASTSASKVRLPLVEL